MDNVQPGHDRKEGPRTELEEFKEFLGPRIASQYSDRELSALRRQMYAMAELLLDIYLDKKRHKPRKNDTCFDSELSAT